jgi:hypothetical protein
MMRIKSGIVCALSMSLAFVFACATTGDDGTGDDQGGSDMTSNNVCGDGTCAATEVGFCTQDCGMGGNNNNGSGSATGAVCGNGQCETTKGENATNCFSDCGGQGSGSGSGSTSTTCPTDPSVCFASIFDATACTGGLDQTTCATCVLGMP